MGYLKKQGYSKQTGRNLYWEEIEAIMYSDPELRKFLDESLFTRNMEGISDPHEANIGCLECH